MLFLLTAAVFVPSSAGCRGKESPAPTPGRTVPGDWIGLDVPGDASAPSPGRDGLAAPARVDATLDITPTAGAIAALQMQLRTATLSVGDRHACWIRPDQRVVCWGENDMGQVDGRPGPVEGPRIVPDVAGAVELGASAVCSCARTDDGRVLCWGDCAVRPLHDRRTFGEHRHVRWWADTSAGFGCWISEGRQAFCSRDRSTVASRREGDIVDFPADVEELAVADELVCGRDAQGAVACITAADRARRPGGEAYWKPRSAEALAGTVRLVAGAGMICALRTSGTVACVVPRASSDAGASPDTGQVAVLEVATANVLDVAGRIAFCATRRDDTTVCWGPPAPGADGNLPERIAPVTVAGSKGMTAVAVDEIACGLDPAGLLYCWDLAELVGGGRARSLGSLGIAGFAGGTQLAVRADVACVRDDAGSVHCRRPNDDAIPPVPRVTGAVNLVAAQDGFCARRTGGWLSCWPAETPVAEADVFTASFERRLPDDLDGDRSDAVVLAAMGDDICIRDAREWSWDCWSHVLDAAHGEPIAAVPGLPEPVQLAIGGAASSCVLSRERAVLCWDAATDVPRVTPIDEFAGAFAVAPWGEQGLCAVMPAGKVACRKRDREIVFQDVEQLGREVSMLAGGPGDRVCATVHARTIYCWAQDPTLDAPVPVATPVDGLNKPRGLAVGETHVCALFAGGDVTCWGDDNHYGQLGRPPFEEAAAPAPVAGLPAAAEIAAGTVSTCAVATTGEVWCWGSRDDPENGWRPRRVEGLLEAGEHAPDG
ncbi:MAG: hypothetical protein HY905_06200 [Deltaproteobacteria bacterium]|nr:hypothetical protein [Deltaproteobacteria bacterium]